MSYGFVTEQRAKAAPVDHNRPLTEAGQTLTTNLDKLSPKDQEFARSLLQSAVSLRGATPAQHHWIEKLAQRATETKPQAEKVMADLGPLNSLFRKARENLKRPHLLIDAGDFGGIKLQQAGEQSRYYGQVYVYTTGAYEERTWLGRIDNEGQFVPSREAEQDGHVKAVVAALAAMAVDPAAAAKAYGQRFGVCCMCSRELTDKRSIHAGYGPICADRWGLPWGECEEVA